MKDLFTQGTKTQALTEYLRRECASHYKRACKYFENTDRYVHGVVVYDTHLKGGYDKINKDVAELGYESYQMMDGSMYIYSK